MEENDFHLIEEYVRTAYDPHNQFRKKEFNRLRHLQLKTTWESVPQQGRHSSFKFYVQHKLLTGHGV